MSHSKIHSVVTILAAIEGFIVRHGYTNRKMTLFIAFLSFLSLSIVHYRLSFVKSHPQSM